MRIRQTAFKTAREAVGITRQQLAVAVGVTEQTIFQYEQGRRKPNIKLAKKIANVINCLPQEII